LKPCRTELPVDGAGPQPNGGLVPRSSPPETTFRYVCLPDTIDPRGPKGSK
jgi:hypothetical protein